MSISLHLNNKQIKIVCEKLDCLNDEIGKVLKASLIEQEESKFYRPLLKTEPEGIPEDLEKTVKNAINYYLVNNDWTKISERIGKINASVIKPTKPEFNI